MTEIVYPLWRRLRPADEGELTEDSSGRIVTGETGLAHTRTGIKSEPNSLQDILYRWIICQWVIGRADGWPDPFEGPGGGMVGETVGSLPIVDNEGGNLLCKDPC